MGYCEKNPKHSTADCVGKKGNAHENPESSTKWPSLVRLFILFYFLDCQKGKKIFIFDWMLRVLTPYYVLFYVKVT